MLSPRTARAISRLIFAIRLWFRLSIWDSTVYNYCIQQATRSRGRGTTYHGDEILNALEHATILVLVGL